MTVEFVCIVSNMKPNVYALSDINTRKNVHGSMIKNLTYEFGNL